MYGEPETTFTPITNTDVGCFFDEIARHDGAGVLGVYVPDDLGFYVAVNDGQVTTLAGARGKRPRPGLRRAVELVAVASPCVQAVTWKQRLLEKWKTYLYTAFKA